VTVGKLAQKTAEFHIGGNFGAALKAGFLLRGEVDRRESEVQDALRIQGLLDSGEYLQIVESFDASNDSGGRAEKVEPRRRFFQLVGWSQNKHIDILKSVPALGEETVRRCRTIGIGHRSIRLLAESPKELREQAKMLASQDGVTKDMLEAVLEKATELAESKCRAEEKAKTAERAAEKAEAKAQKRADALEELRQDMKDRDTRIALLEKGARITNPPEAERLTTEAIKHIKQAMNILAKVDPNAAAELSSQAAAAMYDVGVMAVDLFRRTDAELMPGD